MPYVIPWPTCTMCHAAPVDAKSRCRGCNDLLALQVRLGELEYQFSQRVAAYKRRKQQERS